MLKIKLAMRLDNNVVVNVITEKRQTLTAEDAMDAGER
jgi:hypothetical protein